MRWIVTDDIYAETWRQLLYYSNIDLTIEVILKKHGEQKSKSLRDNLAKQAAQARVCVLQAKEYFDAARTASLFTSPNHSYYGAVALASLMMLINGDGTKSLDYLRTDNKNNHHGLDFSIGCNAKTASVALELAEQSRVEILKYGHFANWYKTLPIRGTVRALVSESYGTTASRGMETVGGYFVPDFETITGAKKTLLELLKFLPDLDADLQQFGISAIRSRTTHEINKDPNGLRTDTWRIHGCRSEAELGALLEKFSITSRYTDALNFQGPDKATSGIVSLKLTNTVDVFFQWPGSRDTMNHDTISYADITETHEITDLYLVAYQLSMLSRYFPDIWIRCLESQCRAAKLIERASEIIVKKFPILALSMLNNEETVISTHREPWKD